MKAKAMCVVGTYDFSGRSLQWNPRYTREGTLLFKLSALYYWPIATKLTSFVWNVREVAQMILQENPSSGTRDTRERVHCHSCKVPFIIDGLQPILHRLSGMCVKWHKWFFRKIPPVEAEIHKRRYIAIQVKCPLVLTDCNQSDVVCIECAWNARCEFLGRSVQWKPTYTRESTLLLK
jgi:hypothetical protein